MINSVCSCNARLKFTSINHSWHNVALNPTRCAANVFRGSRSRRGTLLSGSLNCRPSTLCPTANQVKYTFGFEGSGHKSRMLLSCSICSSPCLAAEETFTFSTCLPPRCAGKVLSPPRQTFVVVAGQGSVFELHSRRWRGLERSEPPCEFVELPSPRSAACWASLEIVSHCLGRSVFRL